MIESDDEFFKRLFLIGAIEVVGVNDLTGDILYAPTDKLKEVDPDFNDKIMDHLFNEINELWVLGFLDMNFMDKNPSIRITEKALKQEELLKLPIEKLNYLRLIMHAMRQ